jgi:hypothetical protein
VRQAEADGGLRPDLPTTQEREEIKRLKRENFELRRGGPGVNPAVSRIRRVIGAVATKSPMQLRSAIGFKPKAGRSARRAGAAADQRVRGSLAYRSAEVVALDAALRVRSTPTAITIATTAIVTSNA